MAYIQVFSVCFYIGMCYNVPCVLPKRGNSTNNRRYKFMDNQRIKTLTETTYQETQEKGGCGECQTSCQSACKTSCTVGNQSCENQ